MMVVVVVIKVMNKMRPMCEFRKVGCEKWACQFHQVSPWLRVMGKEMSRQLARS